MVHVLAQLVHRLDLGPINLVGHSLGGNVSIRFTGLFPEKVRRLVAIECLGFAPDKVAERVREWIDVKRVLSSRQPRRNASIEQAFA